jgi:hypothetical protein
MPYQLYGFIGKFTLSSFILFVDAKLKTHFTAYNTQMGSFMLCMK